MPSGHSSEMLLPNDSCMGECVRDTDVVGYLIFSIYLVHISNNSQCVLDTNGIRSRRTIREEHIF